MTNRKLFVALLATTVIMGGAAAAQAKSSGGSGGSGGSTKPASLIRPYVCGDASTADAVSNYVNVNKLLCNQLATSAKGTDSAGFELASNGVGNAFGKNFLLFDIFGKAGSPSPIIQVTDTNSGVWTASALSGTKVANLPNGETIGFSASQFTGPGGAPGTGLKVQKIDFQLDPSSQQVTEQIGGIKLNNVVATQATKALSETSCPAP